MSKNYFGDEKLKYENIEIPKEIEEKAQIITGGVN